MNKDDINLAVNMLYKQHSKVPYSPKGSWTHIKNFIPLFEEKDKPKFIPLVLWPGDQESNLD